LLAAILALPLWKIIVKIFGDAVKSITFFYLDEHF